MVETLVRLTDAGRRAVHVRDDDECAMILACVQKNRGEPMYLDQLSSVPADAWRWLLDRSNAPCDERGQVNHELAELLGDWPKGSA